MRYRAVSVLILILLMQSCFADLGTEGGNVTGQNISGQKATKYWSAFVGTLNGSVILDSTLPISEGNATTPDVVYPNYPNGTYSGLFNTSLIVTRLPYRPEISDIQSPNASDFNGSGMFSTFPIFSGMFYPTNPESPQNTFLLSWNLMTCYLFTTPFLCPYVTLDPDVRMAVLKYDNGTAIEPIFISIIMNQTGYNGSPVDFQFMVPALAYYYFYTYQYQECEITVWIDGVQTTTFPKTAVPYGVDVLVTDGLSNPISDLHVIAGEYNGRNLLYPIIRFGKELLGIGAMTTDSNGRTVFALSPTRYNIPDQYGYQGYVEVNENGYYCRENFTIATYDYISPTYRSSLVSPTYESQVKASVQNMNALASTASKWIDQGKMRQANITVWTNGSYSALPTLKAGAPNMLNITLINHTSLAVVDSTIVTFENNGHIVFVPNQPGKDWYNNSDAFDSNKTFMIIPTRYNTPSVFRAVVGDLTAPYAVLTFNVDSVLGLPAPSEADMDLPTRSAVAAALQNINSVLVNMGKSLSTV